MIINHNNFFNLKHKQPVATHLYAQIYLVTLCVCNHYITASRFVLMCVEASVISQRFGFYEIVA